MGKTYKGKRRKEKAKRSTKEKNWRKARRDNKCEKMPII